MAALQDTCIDTFPVHCTREPAARALLELEIYTHNLSRNPNALNTPCKSGVCHCYSVQEMDEPSKELSGWEGKIVEPSSSTHCVLLSHIPSSNFLYSTSDITLHHKASLSGNYRPQHAHGRGSLGSYGISKSDSRSSLKGYMYLHEPPPIHYEFTHYIDDAKRQEDAIDLATRYIEKYKKTYTYPNVQQRMVSSSSIGRGVSGQQTLCSACASSVSGGSHHISPMLKPKLLVLGEPSCPGNAYAKPYWKKPRSFKRVFPMEPAMDAFQSKPKLRYNAPTLAAQTQPEEKPEHLTSSETQDTPHHDYGSSRSHPSLAAFIGDEILPKVEKKVKPPVMSVKWASRVFPSFMVSSANAFSPDSQKAKASSTKTGSNGSKKASQASRTRHLLSKAPFHDFSTRSMPLIAPSGLATKTEFSHLLRHQTQVSFHNTRPGFRYETLCLQGHNTSGSNSSPVTVVGPWITTH